MRNSVRVVNFIDTSDIERDHCFRDIVHRLFVIVRRDGDIFDDLRVAVDCVNVIVNR